MGFDVKNDKLNKVLVNELSGADSTKTAKIDDIRLFGVDETKNDSNNKDNFEFVNTTNDKDSSNNYLNAEKQDSKSYFQQYNDLKTQIAKDQAKIIQLNSKLSALGLQKTQINSQLNAETLSYQALEQQVANANQEYAQIISKINQLTQSLEQSAQMQQKEMIYSAMAQYDPQKDGEWSDFIQDYAGNFELNSNIQSQLENLISVAEFKQQNLSYLGSMLSAKAMSVNSLSNQLTQIDSTITSVQGQIQAATLNIIKSQSQLGSLIPLGLANSFTNLMFNPLNFAAVNNNFGLNFMSNLYTNIMGFCQKEMNKTAAFSFLNPQDQSRVLQNNIDLAQTLPNGSPRYVFAQTDPNSSQYTLYDMNENYYSQTKYDYNGNQLNFNSYGTTNAWGERVNTFSIGQNGQINYSNNDYRYNPINRTYNNFAEFALDSTFSKDVKMPVGYSQMGYLATLPMTTMAPVALNLVANYNFESIAQGKMNQAVAFSMLNESDKQFVLNNNIDLTEQSPNGTSRYVFVENKNGTCDLFDKNYSKKYTISGQYSNGYYKSNGYNYDRKTGQMLNSFSIKPEGYIEYQGKVGNQTKKAQYQNFATLGFENNVKGGYVKQNEVKDIAMNRFSVFSQAAFSSIFQKAALAANVVNSAITGGVNALVGGINSLSGAITQNNTQQTTLRATQTTQQVFANIQKGQEIIEESKKIINESLNKEYEQ